MKTGLDYWFGYAIEINKRFSLIREVGFDCVMLWWGDEFRDINGDKELLPDLARKSGLEIENIHAPYEGVNEIWRDNINGKEIMNLYISCLDDCVKYDISTMVLHVTTGNNPPPISEVGIERIKKIVDYSQNRGIYIALENLRNPEYLKEIFKKTDSPNLGFCYDSGHENCYSRDLDFLNMYGNKLIALHLHDNDGTNDQHRILGEGTINWKNVRNRIKRIGYTKPITMEVTNEFSKKYANLDAESFLKNAYEKLKIIFD